jgi:pimeloyl-ACP methyl ester carboxylesterase
VTPLILVPGLLCDRRLWRHQVEGLADLAGPVLVPDVTGGDSVAEMARGVLDTAPERFALAGLSMGGYVSLEVVRQAPERVEALALLDTSARPDTPEQTEARLALVGLARSGRFDEVWRLLLPRIVHPDRVEDPEIRSTVREMAHAVGPEGFERQERAIIGRPDSRGGLPAISCPTLVCAGRTTPSRPRTCTKSSPTGYRARACARSMTAATSPPSNDRRPSRAPCARGSETSRIGPQRKAKRLGGSRL